VIHSVRRNGSHGGFGRHAPTRSKPTAIALCELTLKAYATGPAIVGQWSDIHMPLPVGPACGCHRKLRAKTLAAPSPPCVATDEAPCCVPRRIRRTSRPGRGPLTHVTKYLMLFHNQGT
jgi:hypothetical protein